MAKTCAMSGGEALRVACNGSQELQELLLALNTSCTSSSMENSTGEREDSQFSKRQRAKRHIQWYSLAIIIGIIPTTTAQTQTPTVTQVPKSSPPPSAVMLSFSHTPSEIPTQSPSTTPGPSMHPTQTFSPSFEPSLSISPSTLPSLGPTAEPTFSSPILAAAKFRQKLTIGNGRIFTPEEVVLFQGLYRSYTINFAPPLDVAEGKIDTACVVGSQVGLEGRRYLLRGDCPHGRLLQTFQFVEVDFTMSYSSIYTNVTTFPLLFQSYLNQNLATVALQMQLLGLNVTEAASASRIIVRPEPTPAPTTTRQPTSLPTTGPSLSDIPSDLPSLLPTFLSSKVPTFLPSKEKKPSSAPTRMPSDGSGPKGNSTNTVIVVSVVVAGLTVLIGLLVYFRKRKLLREVKFRTNTAGDNEKQAPHEDGSWNAVMYTHSAKADQDVLPGSPLQGGVLANEKKMGMPRRSIDGVHSPSESLVSNQSLLSAGNSIAGDSGDEADATHNLADEFDQYKDQNLEKMRTDVEGSLTGFDSMMSQALTRALIDEDDAHVDPGELLWGGSGKLEGAEVEASALGEVTDWLKRKEHASLEERRIFMQDTLNKMVASVRHGVLGPDDASRSIHECAALLGLQLATDVPSTTLIVSGMRKTVTSRDMVEAFNEFGDISEAAVASNQRGFGILRFKANQSVDRAMKKFRTEEIVVQDVAVQVKLLKPESTIGDTVDPTLAGVTSPEPT